MRIRRFNAAGIAAFRALLAATRDNPRATFPRDSVEDDALTETIPALITIEPKRFPTRREAAEYLTNCLAPLPPDEVAHDAGLWSWLSLYYFDEVCPARYGQRKVKNDYTYIFEPRNPRHFYRHLLFIAWYAHGVARPHDRLYMNVPLASLDKVTDEVMKRLYLTRIPCIFDVLDRIYWDASRGKARSGIASYSGVRPGDLTHRFPIRIRQLEKTYDLQSLTADQLIELLGEEFQQHARVAART